MPTLSPDQLAAKIEAYQMLASCTYDPLRYTRMVFPWGEPGELERFSGPHDWQVDILSTIRDHLKNKATRYTPLRISVASGHGIGKSALVAMIAKWGLGTCDDAKIVCTANTKSQLETKTSPELGKWFRLAVDAQEWDVKTLSITSKSPGSEKTWRMDLIPWSENNPEAFAGLHNQGRLIILIFDEASSIAKNIWETAQGALTDENTIIIWLAFGNPTQNTGNFRECFGKSKHRWLNRQIDSRTVPGTNKTEIESWVNDYGEDSDFVRVRVKGEFPRAGSTQFIPSDAVAKCRQLIAEGFETLPKIMAIDVARFGDDQSVIGIRQGRKARILKKLRGKDTVEVAQFAIDEINREKPDAIVVDGDGLGAGVVDALKHRGLSNVHEFHGGETAEDSAKYFNRRAEVWGMARDWLVAGGDLPDDPELETDLTGVQYGFSNKQQIQLEKKEDMKARGVASPDLGDMFAMTFAVKMVLPPAEARKEEIEHRLSLAKDANAKMIEEQKIILEERKQPKTYRIKPYRFGRRG